MKHKFFKNLFQSISCFIGLLFGEALLLVVFFAFDNKDKTVLNLLLLTFIIPALLFFTIGLYWVFQKVIISKEGIKILFIKRVVKEYEWNEVECVEVSNYMKNPALKIILNDSSEFYLDKRKSIIRAIEFYSNKTVLK